MLRGKGIEVLGFIDGAHANAGCIHVDLVDATRLLSEPPVGRERRQFEKFDQQGTVLTHCGSTATCSATTTARRPTLLIPCSDRFGGNLSGIFPVRSHFSIDE